MTAWYDVTGKPGINNHNRYESSAAGVQPIEKITLTARRFYQVLAWAVHFYTALGLVAGLMAIDAIYRGEAQHVFIWLAVAAFIDATDGTLARRFEVKRWASQFDGCLLDNIIDFLNYTFIPVVFAYRFELIPPSALPVLALVLFASAYGFCITTAKTADGYFTGFPNYWNVMIFYFYLLEFPPLINALIMSIFVVLVFVPIRYISASTEKFRSITVVVMVLFGVALVIMGATMYDVDKRLVVGSLVAATYYFVASFYLHLTEKP